MDGWTRAAARLFTLLLLVVVPHATALSQAADGSAPPEAAAPDTIPDAIPSHARALIAILRDDGARQALIAELERIAATDPESTATASAEPPPAEAEEPMSVARQAAQLTRETAEQVTGIVVDVWEWAMGLAILLEAGDAYNLQVLWDAAVALALVVAATVVLFYLLSRLAGGLYGWLARRAAGAGWLRTTSLVVASSMIDAVVILIAWAAGYAIALYVLGDAGRMDIRQSLYLNAFLLIELIKVALRLVFAPRYGDLRLLPMADLTANYWYFWFSRITALLGYGLLLVVPIINTNLSAAIGTAVGTLIGLIALIIAVTVVLRNRVPVRRALEMRVDGARGDFVARLLVVIARVWHLVALAYLLALFVISVLRPGGALSFVIEATARSVVAVAVGVAVTLLISRAIAGGMRLPAEVRRRLPLLEPRLNAFVPAILQVVRLLVLAGIVLAVAQAWGFFDMLAWAATAAGQELVSRALGVALIVLLALAVWLALVSWMDYRLNMEFGRTPGARERTLLALVRNAATIAIVIVATMFALAEVGINIAPLLAGAGVLGLAIGFGAQKMVQDIITGIFIQFDNAINEGEVVTAGGLTGVVEKLTIRSVALRDLQGVYHIIPFSSVDSVSNFMRGFGFHVAEIGIAYREDVEEAKALMHRAFDELREDPEVGPTLLEPLEWHGLTQFGDSAIMLRARIKTTPGSQWAAGRAYNALVKKLFDAHGIEIPFPHLTLYFGEHKDGRAAPAHILLERRRSQRAAADAEPPAPVPTDTSGRASDAPPDPETQI